MTKTKGLPPRFWFLSAFLTVVPALCAGLLGDLHALDTDAVNLALGSEIFDIPGHQPHPPGYLGYVLLLKLLRAATGLSPMEGALWLSRICSGLAVAAAIWAGWTATRRSDIALWTGGLMASSPVLLYYALDGQAHPGEMLASALLMGLALRLDQGTSPRLRDALAYGALAGLGGSLRPSLVLVVLLPGLWSLRHLGIRGILIAGAAGLSATLMWLVPTVVLTGGWAVWREASQALMGTLYVENYSMLSAGAVDSLVRSNLATVAVGALLVFLPVLGLIGLLTPGGGDRVPLRGPTVLALLAVVPGLFFYAVVYCAESGYLLGFLPWACLLGAFGLAVSRSSVFAAGLVGLQLAVFFGGPPAVGPGLPGEGTPVSGYALAAERWERSRLWHAYLFGGSPPEGPGLVLSDKPGVRLGRQLPLIHPQVDYLAVQSSSFVLFQEDTLMLFAAEGTVAAPSGTALVGGGPSVIHRTKAYQWVWIDPLSSEDFRLLLLSQSQCAEARPMPATCFPQQPLSLGQHGLVWGSSRNGIDSFEIGSE